MNFGLAAEAEAVPTSARSAAELTRLDKRRSRCDRNGAAATDELEQAV